ncbi:MAG: hypothetical protein IIB22_06620 [Chloroflexi bacterium]|nr:hypothetical protein [Chloroflexota bacterium]
MAGEITIAELVRNGTMSAEMAATLWAAVDEGRSFLTVAIPRFAGKSTLSNAVLALRPPDVPLHLVDGSPELMQRLTQERLGGYLVVAEFSQAPVPGYIWGEPVRRVFDTLGAGYSLQAALHAPGVEEAIRAVTEGNGVSDELASAFELVLYIERFGDDEESFWRRLAEVYEVDRVRGGRPEGRTLFRWQADADRFDTVEAPRGFALGLDEIEARAAVIADLVSSGHTTESDVAAAVAAYRAR